MTPATVLQMLKRSELPEIAFKELSLHAAKRKLICFRSPLGLARWMNLRRRAPLYKTLGDELPSFFAPGGADKNP